MMQCSREKSETNTKLVKEKSSKKTKYNDKCTSFRLTFLEDIFYNLS